MAERLIELFASLPQNVWEPRPPGDETALAALERAYELELPSDYRSLLLHSDGGSLMGAHAAMNLEPIEVLMWHNRDERFVKYLSGMFVIGDDGGGSVYYYDPGNRHGKGNWALFLIPLGELASDWQRFTGRRLTETVERILEGDSFFD